MRKVTTNSAIASLFASYAGQLWIVLMSLAFIPIYIDLLGIESYGIIAFYGFLQASLALLDLGLRSALSRESVHYFSGKSMGSFSDLLRSIELVFIYLSCLLVLVVNISAEFFATTWFISTNLEASAISSSLKFMSFIAALRFMEGIYSSILLGQQKHILLNSILASVATLKGAGAVFVLMFYSANLESFFIWQLVVSAVSLAAMWFYANKSAGLVSGGQFSLSELQRIKPYALSVAAASVLGVAIANFDKLLVSKLVPLSEFGVYALAVTIASVILTLAGPINQIWLPKLTELVVEKRASELTREFHFGAQINTFVVGSLAVFVSIYAYDLVLFWTADKELSRMVGPLLRVLVVGNMLSALSRYIFQAAYAHGSTILVLYLNIIAVIFIIPSLFLIVPIFGAMGAAYLWIIYSASVFFVGCYLFFNEILIGERFHWYIFDTVLPLISGAFCSALFYLFLPRPTFFLGSFLVLAAGLIVTLFGSLLALPLLRCLVFQRWRPRKSAS